MRSALPVVATRLPGGRLREEANCFGLGVTLSGAGIRGLRCTADGVLKGTGLARGAEASDMGGDGGSCSSETVSAVAIDLVSGGVETMGELAVELGE